MRDWRNGNSRFWTAVVTWGRAVKRGEEAPYLEVESSVQELINEARAEGKAEASLVCEAAPSTNFAGVYDPLASGTVWDAMRRLYDPSVPFDPQAHKNAVAALDNFAASVRQGARKAAIEEFRLQEHAASTVTAAAGYGGTAETADDDEGALLDRIVELEDLNASLIRSVELLAARE